MQTSLNVTQLTNRLLVTEGFSGFFIFYIDTAVLKSLKSLKVLFALHVHIKHCLFVSLTVFLFVLL